MYIDMDMPEARKVASVFLNEVMLYGVIAVDTEEGWAELYSRDDKGMLVMGKGEIKKEKLYGEVTVLWLNEED